MGLRTFPNAYFQVDGIALGLHFHRVDLAEHITVVPIDVADGIVIVFQTFSHQFLVIDIAFFHTENFVQTLYIAHLISRIDRVSDPRNVAQIVFRAFIDLHKHVHVLRIDRPHAVLDDDGVAIAQFVVFLDEFFLVFLPPLRREFLGFQERREFAGLVGLRQCAFPQKTALDFAVAELFVALDDDVSHLHLLFFVDDNVENHVVFLRHVVALHHVDFGVLKAFFVEIFLGEQFGAVEHIRMDAQSRRHAEPLLQILFFRLFHADVVDFRHTRTTCQRNVQIDAVSDDGIGGNGDLREESVPPITLHGVGDLRARHFDFLSDGQTRNACDGEVFVTVHSRHVDAAENQRARRSGVGNVGEFDDILGMRSEK